MPSQRSVLVECCCLKASDHMYLHCLGLIMCRRDSFHLFYLINYIGLCIMKWQIVVTNFQIAYK